MCNVGQGERWLKGKIVEVTGPVFYRVQIDEGSIRRCHQDQILIPLGPEPKQNEECRHD